MFSYINTIILKGESDNKQSKVDNQNEKKCHDHSEKTVKTDKPKTECDKTAKGKLDPFMQRIMFPLYLDYQSQNDKLLREEKNSSKQSELIQSETKMDWKIFTPSNIPIVNIPIVNTQKENGEKNVKPNQENINVRPRTNDDMLAFIETLQ